MTSLNICLWAYDIYGIWYGGLTQITQQALSYLKEGSHLINLCISSASLDSNIVVCKKYNHVVS